MKLNKKETSALKALNNHSVNYVVIGGMAVENYVPGRKRKDIDIWLDANESNANSFLEAITSLIGYIPKLTIAKLANPGLHLRLKELGYSFDILTSLKGVSFSFSDAYTSMKHHTIKGLSIPIIDKKKLIESKRVTNDPKDIEDVRLLSNNV